MRFPPAGFIVVTLAFTALAPIARGDLVYATSFSTGELIRYDLTDPVGSRTVLIPSGTMTRPSAAAIGPDGNLYIGVDGDGASVAPSIERYDVAGGTLSSVHTFASFDVFPGSLVFDGDDLLVGRNPFFGNTGSILRLTNVTGGTVTVSERTTGGSLASSPGLAIAPDGRLYVADQTYDFLSGVASGSVKRFDAAGVFLGEVVADGAAGLAGPVGLAIRGTTLYTGSIMNGAVLRTDLASDATTTFGTTGNPFEVGALALLSDGGLLAGSPSGFTGNIYRFAADGSLLSGFASGLGQIGGLATVAVPEPAMNPLAAGGMAAAAWLVRQSRRR